MKLLATLLVLLAAGAATLALRGGGDERPSRAGRVITVVVPRGTAAQVAARRPVRAVPDRIVARVGDTLRLVNDDRASHTLGPFLVGPHETVTSELARTGTFKGYCSAHPGRDIAIVVRP